jgi:hypothetical protein
MKRELPFLSPISIAFTIIVLAILGFSVWQHGGLSFSPGEVTAQSRQGIVLQGFATHAEFEEQCEYCHQPLKIEQSLLCTSCHESISTQQIYRTGTHGQIDQTISCKNCHPEHRGKSFDPLTYALSQFDHQQVDLLLTGAHALLSCETCHENENYQLAYQGCSDCHAEPELHTGMFDSSCDTCHTDLAWRPVLMDGQVFDHDQSRFSLVRHDLLPSGESIVCADCHSSDTPPADLQACTACHLVLAPDTMETHVQTVGEDCLQCHDGKDRMADFDHAAFFLLDGKHARLQCAACHTDFRFTGTPDLCQDCHAEPDIHAGSFGTECQRCHTTQAWAPAMLTQHTFPLDHGEQGIQSCQTCHVDTYPAYTCYNCHEHQPDEIAREHLEEGISTEELMQCADCHPTGREEEGSDDED